MNDLGYSVATAASEKQVATVTGRELRTLRDCAKAFDYGRLSIQYQGHEAVGFLYRVLQNVKAMLVMRKERNEVIAAIENEFAQYDETWFHYIAEYEYCKQRDLKKLIRLVDYVYDQEYEVLYADFPCNLTFGNGSLVLAGRSFDKIEETVDLILAKGSERIAVQILLGKPEYSYQARKFEKKVENSIELLAMYMGIQYRFLEGKVLTQRWYLGNKDDNAQGLAPKFDHRPGKNIISYDYSSWEKEKLQKHFMHVLIEMKDEGVCEKCKHASICQMSRQVHTCEKKRVKKQTGGSIQPMFTPSQEEVVAHMDGPMCVIAVPGAGKTFALVHRLVNLIQEGVSASNVLFVTFTRRAAEEIHERVEEILRSIGHVGNLPTITTFNALCYTILKENPIFLRKRVKLAKDVDRYRLISEVLSEVPQIEGISYANMFDKFGIVRILDGLFEDITERGVNRFMEDFTGKKDVEGILRAYKLYSEKYAKRGFISFDEQISLCTEMFVKYPAIQKKYADRFTYIMVDEYQDSNKDQVDFVYGIARYHNNLVVTGDDDQSIYGWRGSSNEYMLNFRNSFPDAKIVFMQDNFRSDEGILDTCNALIRVNSDRYSKKLVAHSSTGRRPVYLKNFEPQKMPQLVTELLSDGYNLSEIAILARYNKRLVELAEILEPHFPIAAGRDKLTDDTIFRAVRDVLSLYYDGLDQDEEFYRFFGYHNHDSILRKKIRNRSFYQNQLELKTMQALDLNDPACLEYYRSHATEDSFSKEGYRLLTCFTGIRTSRTLEEGLAKILSAMYGFKEHKITNGLCELAGQKSILSLKELYHLMNDMILYGVDETVDYRESEAAINLMTVHEAKGKEFKAVIIYAMEDFEEKSEEIRVLYVGMSRAKRRLYMTESTYAYCSLFPYFENEVDVK